MSEELVFDLNPIEIPVTVGGNRYVLREASGEAQTAYMNAQMSGVDVNEEGKPIRFREAANADPLLVSYCLFRTDKDGNPVNVRVPLEKIQSWPARIQKVLIQKVKEISGMVDANDESQVEAIRGLSGNGPEPTTDGSG